MTQPTDQSSREQEREVPRPAKAKGWSALDLHAAQCYEDAQRFAPRLPDPPTVSAPTAGQLQLSALWELQARVGDAHENHGRNDERTMKAREVFYEALRSALSTPPIAITAEEAGREGEAVQLREVHRLLTNAIPFRLGLIERSSSRAEAEVNCERIREMLATVLAELPPAQGGQE